MNPSNIESFAANFLLADLERSLALCREVPGNRLTFVTKNRKHE
jgi:hypothetical protein